MNISRFRCFSVKNHMENVCTLPALYKLQISVNQPVLIRYQSPETLHDWQSLNSFQDQLKKGQSRWIKNSASFEGSIWERLVTSGNAGLAGELGSHLRAFLSGLQGLCLHAVTVSTDQFSAVHKADTFSLQVWQIRLFFCDKSKFIDIERSQVSTSTCVWIPRLWLRLSGRKQGISIGCSFRSHSLALNLLSNNSRHTASSRSFNFWSFFFLTCE